MNAAKILLVEDDEQIVDVILNSLNPEDYLVTVASDGVQGLCLAQTQQPDLVILDICLPKLDGLSICRALRDDPTAADIPILFLSGKSLDEDKIAGFRAGADDYLCKPFHLGELELRVAALLRRTRKQPISETEKNYTFSIQGGPHVSSATHYPASSRYLKVGGFTLDVLTYEVSTPERGKFRLTPVQFNLLQFLMSHPGKIFSTGVLLNSVWGYPQGTGSSDLVRVHIKSLRERIESDPSHPAFIRTVSGYGYTVGTGNP